MAEGHSKLTINPAPSKVRVKEEEDDGDSRVGHLHHFRFKLSNAHNNYNITCDRPRTVLEALKTSERYPEYYLDENVVIQLGKEERKIAIATHFPCCLIETGELLVILCESEKVEEAKRQEIPSQSSYITFCIDREGGQNTKTKQLFMSNNIKQFKYLCVYAERGITVEEALKRDGRFMNNLGKFTLSDNADSTSHTEHTQLVDKLHGKEFKICLPRGKRGADSKGLLRSKRAKSRVSEANKENQQANQSASHDSQHSDDKSVAKPISDVVKRRGRSVSGVNIDHAEISSLLRKQFPDLKQWMESRFPGDSYQKALDLRKEDFGKIQQSFSEVHRVRKLLDLGQSVCRVVVGDVCQGTGFILFDNFILTNAHLFKDCVVQDGDKWQVTTDVHAVFNYENPSGRDSYWVKVKKTIIAYNFHASGHELDYAILELDPDTQTAAPQTESEASQTKQKLKLPPGLLKKCGPVPVDGEACIIGHPAGDVKKLDPTCIIEKEKRVEAVDKCVETYKDHVFPLCSVGEVIKNQGIHNILQGGAKVDKVVTYNTFMYHGSSGSPVFDAHGRVFGLHTAGFFCEEIDSSVIEYAHPLIAIFKTFVIQLKKSKNDELLEKVKEEVKNNLYLKEPLKEALESVSDVKPSDPVEPMETS
ncbi:serine protease FAM111A-like [Centroberyx affinis]|uniref:serine protease FAM111A-like n=1 Tax=Centroberyx affinis TaxID=166261 RepID=UPI003A5BC66B